MPGGTVPNQSAVLPLNKDQDINLPNIITLLFVPGPATENALPYPTDRKARYGDASERRNKKPVERRCLSPCEVPAGEFVTKSRKDVDRTMQQWWRRIKHVNRKLKTHDPC